MFKLRPYQQEAVDKAIEYFHDKTKGGALVVAPTASGKSIIIASIAKELKGKTIVFQPNREILEQNYEKMCIYGYGDDVKIFSASLGQKEIGKITLATIGSAINKKELFEDFDNIIVDEAHLMNPKGGMYQDFIDHIGAKKILGLTATPFRMYSYVDFQTDELSVVAKMLTRTRPRIFNKIIQITQIEEMYKQKFLCPIKYVIGSEYDQSDIALNTTGMDFIQEELMQYNLTHNLVGLVERQIKENNGKHVLVFCVFVHEAEELRDKLNESGIVSATVSAKTPKQERKQILEDFKAGKIKVITNVGTLTTGFDFPELDMVVLARPTKSIALYMQMVGRAMRLHENKPYAIIVDICNNYQNFGKVETFKFIETKKNLHRLVSDNGPLTGFDFYNQKDLELRNYEGMKEKEFSTDIIAFGKYKGEHVSKLPQHYLKWCAKTFDKGKWKEMFQKELERRDKK
jgi:DNA repair protein RadD